VEAVEGEEEGVDEEPDAAAPEDVPRNRGAPERWGRRRHGTADVAGSSGCGDRAGGRGGARQQGQQSVAAWGARQRIFPRAASEDTGWRMEAEEEAERDLIEDRRRNLPGTAAGDEGWAWSYGSADGGGGRGRRRREADDELHHSTRKEGAVALLRWERQRGRRKEGVCRGSAADEDGGDSSRTEELCEALASFVLDGCDGLDDPCAVEEEERMRRAAHLHVGPSHGAGAGLSQIRQRGSGEAGVGARRTRRQGWGGRARTASETNSLHTDSHTPGARSAGMHESESVRKALGVLRAWAPPSPFNVQPDAVAGDSKLVAKSRAIGVEERSGGARWRAGRGEEWECSGRVARMRCKSPTSRNLEQHTLDISATLQESFMRAEHMMRRAGLLPR